MCYLDILQTSAPSELLKCRKRTLRLKKKFKKQKFKKIPENLKNWMRALMRHQCLKIAASVLESAMPIDYPS
jgi:hypothetical protein